MGLMSKCILFVLVAAAQSSSPLSPEQLKPLTNFRQQHRRLVPALPGQCRGLLDVCVQVDGRLCAAAFVQVWSVV